jgi:hypothetical protein
VGQKVRLKSAARHLYAGRLIMPNEEFDAELQDAQDLVALNFARVVPVVMETLPVEQTPKRRQYRRRDMEADKE